MRILLALAPVLLASAAAADELLYIEETAQGVFRVLDKDASGGKSMGDVELWTAPAADSDGKVVGTSSGHCLFVSATHKHCTWSLDIEDSGLAFIGFVDDTQADRVYTVSGGRGRFAGASGSMLAVDKFDEHGIYEMRLDLVCGPRGGPTAQHSCPWD